MPNLLMVALMIATHLVASVSSMQGCNAEAPYPCLPGVDAVGIGFDAVRGTSTGVGRQVVNFSFVNPGQTWRDPFGNRTVYSFPDQAKVTQKTTQFLRHGIYRSVTNYVEQQTKDANVDVKAGPWFSGSAKTSHAQALMKDGMHIIAESMCELGVYQITLDPALLLHPSSKLPAYLSLLPTTYDPTAYAQFVADWGTHFVSSATLGGRATMSTVIAQEYYSKKSDSSIQAQLQISWGIFGGGGGGGSSSQTHDSTWTSNTNSQTMTEGGDPAIKSFNSQGEWAKWAQSVETSSPIITSYTLQPIYMLPLGPKQANVRRAVQDYAAKHNITFPAADPADYRMSWCDCYDQNIPDGCATESDCQLVCSDGFVAVGMGISKIENHEGFEIVPNGWANNPLRCCRPCFKADG